MTTIAGDASSPKGRVQMRRREDGHGRTAPRWLDLPQGTLLPRTRSPHVEAPDGPTVRHRWRTAW